MVWGGDHGDVGHGTWCGATELNHCSPRLESLSLAASQNEPPASAATRDIPAGFPVCPVLLVPGQCDGPGQPPVAQRAEAEPGGHGSGCWGYVWDGAAEQFALQVWGGGALQSRAGSMAGMGAMAGTRMMAGMGIWLGAIFPVTPGPALCCL